MPIAHCPSSIPPYPSMPFHVVVVQWLQMVVEGDDVAADGRRKVWGWSWENGLKNFQTTILD